MKFSQGDIVQTGQRDWGHVEQQGKWRWQVFYFINTVRNGIGSCFADTWHGVPIYVPGEMGVFIGGNLSCPFTRVQTSANLTMSV